jgi:hypothetical protein
MKWILTALIAFVLQLFLPWGIVSVAAFVVAMRFDQSPLQAMGNGFLGIAFLWLVWAGVISFQNGGVLAERIAILFSLPSGILSVLVTALVGGIVGAVAALSGNLLRNLTRKV